MKRTIIKLKVINILLYQIHWISSRETFYYCFQIATRPRDVDFVWCSRIKWQYNLYSGHIPRSL